MVLTNHPIGERLQACRSWKGAHKRGLCSLQADQAERGAGRAGQQRAQAALKRGAAHDTQRLRRAPRQQQHARARAQGPGGRGPLLAEVPQLCARAPGACRSPRRAQGWAGAAGGADKACSSACCS